MRPRNGGYGSPQPADEKVESMTTAMLMIQIEVAGRGMMFFFSCGWALSRTMGLGSFVC